MSVSLKTLPPMATNPQPFPVGSNFGNMVAWQEAQAQVGAYNKNQQLASDYVNTTFGNWLAQYSIGKLPWDAVPPQPPVQQFAAVTETTWPNGAAAVVWDTIDDPNGGLVCAVPMYQKEPPPQGGKVSLMGVLTSEGSNASTATVPMVAPGNSATSLDGKTTWVRMS